MKKKTNQNKTKSNYRVSYQTERSKEMYISKQTLRLEQVFMWENGADLRPPNFLC